MAAACRLEELVNVWGSRYSTVLLGGTTLLLWLLLLLCPT